MFPTGLWKTALALLLLLLPAALAQPAQADRLIVATITDVVQLDPTDIGDDPSSLVGGHVMDHLVQRGLDGTHEPALAESWSASEDGRTWTFNLREGVKFHDGSPFNSEVVKWHFDRVLSGNGPARFQAQWSIIDSVDTPDEHTVVFNLSAATAGFIDLVIMTNGGMIMSQHAVETNGVEAFALHPIGTGPFKFQEWIPGQYTLLVRNDDHWGGPAGVAELMLRPIPEVGTQVIELETGGVHLITALGEEDWEHLQDSDRVVTHSAPAYRNRMFRFASVAPFDDPLVREAMQYAADYATITSILVGDMGTPANNPIIPIASWSYPEDLGNVPSYNPERARELFAEAGWTPGADGILQKDGQKLQITVISPSGRYFQDREISLASARQWRDVGIDATVQVMEWAPFLEDLYAGDFQVAISGWNQSSPEPSIFADPLLGTGARGNYGPWSDEQLDDLLVRASATTDQDERKELYRQVLERTQELAWFIPLYNENKVAAVSNKIEGYQHSPNFTRYQTIHFK